jgi:hypothetical protein
VGGSEAPDDELFQDILTQQVKRHFNACAPS